MSKKVLIISTSMRNHSNSDRLAEEFARGAEAAGNSVEKISLIGKDIQFCRGCMACQKTQQCVIKDSVAPIIERMKAADAIVFATPIYYYEMSGQMKTLLDRSNPLFPSEYNFRGIYLMATAADGDPSAVDRAVTGLEGWIACFEKAYLAGVVRGVGVTDAGDIHSKADMLMEAYDMGYAVGNNK